MYRSTRSLSRCAALALLAAPCLGHAAVRCVGNEQQLATALADAKLSTDGIFIIKLRTGTYDNADSPAAFSLRLEHSNQLLELSGGWSGANGSCQDKSFDPALTVLLGTPNRSALEFAIGAPGYSGDTVYVHDVTLRNAGFGGANSYSCLTGTVRDGATAQVDRVNMEQCIATGVTSGAAGLGNLGGTLTMHSISVRNSRSASNGGLLVNTLDGGTSYLSHISVTTAEATNPSARASGLYLQNSGSGVAYLSNSVLWGNDPTFGTEDLYVSGSGIHLTRVHRGGIYGVAASDVGASSGDPGFIATGDAHLRADSLLIDSGVANPQGGSGTFDADGAARTQGAAVDIGAFETNPDRIFRNRFD